MDQTHSDIFPIIAAVALVAVIVIYFVPITQIIHKAGYSRWWILIWLVPIANIVFLWIFAFSRWPLEDRK